MTGVRVRDEDGSVRVVTIDRPERRNALDLETRVALLDALRAAGESSRAVVLTGAGPVFCSGGDLAAMTPEAEAARYRLSLVSDVARAIAAGPVPVVAAVEGGAWGLGLSLACAADVVVGAEGSRWAASFSRMGLAPDGGLSWSLPRRVGPGPAAALILTARTVEAEEAQRTGIVDELVPAGGTLDRAVAIATDLAALPQEIVAGVRRGVAAPPASLDDALDRESDLQVRLLAGPEFARRRAAFLDRPAR